MSEVWSAVDGGHLLLKHTEEGDPDKKGVKSVYHLVLHAETHQPASHVLSMKQIYGSKKQNTLIKWIYFKYWSQTGIFHGICDVL